MTFGMEKPEWCGNPMVKKSEDTITRFDIIHECDGRTHRQNAAWPARLRFMDSIVRQKPVYSWTSVISVCHRCCIVRFWWKTVTTFSESWPLAYTRDGWRHWYRTFEDANRKLDLAVHCLSFLPTEEIVEFCV